ncbi:MAG: phosphatidate cytidylyltransferase [Rhodocyclaceae bacterium]
MLKARVLTAIVLAAALLAAIFALPVKILGLFVGAIVWLAVGEWAKLVKMERLGGMIFQTVIALIVIRYGFADPTVNRGMMLMLIFLCALSFWILTAPGLLKLFMPLGSGYVAYLIGATVFIPAGIAMIFLVQVSPWMLLAALAPVWIADIAAFFVGRAFGRRKLAPTISPGKSWEGAIGAVVAVIIYALLLWAFVPAIAARIGIPLLILVAIVYTAMSVVGDLFESMVKRHAGVKDSGTLLPGHGGILDRIDSVLPTLPLAAALVVWLH